MFNFWTRRPRKLSIRQRSTNVLPLSQLDTAEEPKALFSSPLNLAEAPSEQQNGLDHKPQPEPQEEQYASQPAPEPYVAIAPNPHDSIIAEIKNELRLVETLTTPRKTEQTGDPTGLNESLFDPATGDQRGTFDSSHPHSTSPTDSNPTFDHSATNLANDEVWTHLVRVRELQSDIARMHAHMEGVGDTRHVLDLDVDADIDVDSVPTQEEEEAVKRQKEFEKLPRRFTGRSDNIDAIMSKLDDLSQAVTAFHALQPPPLNFQNNTVSEETVDDLSSPLSTRMSIPSNMRNKRLSFPTSIRSASGSGSKNPLSAGAGVMHDSPVSIQNTNRDFIDSPNR